MSLVSTPVLSTSALNFSLCPSVWRMSGEDVKFDATSPVSLIAGGV